MIHNNPNPLLRGSLAQAERVANASLNTARIHHDNLLIVLNQFQDEVEKSKVDTADVKLKSARTVANEFSVKYVDLCTTIKDLVTNSTDAVSSAYFDRERNARFVTVMLFGRTRAGKSTTMEAITGGDGTTIGVGRQHTTTEVKSYYFPAPEIDVEPDYPCLRIVDTPGIEGFEGDELSGMAEEFIERSDHILFLLTDDKAASSELDRFGLIKNQGKGVTVLLNVKAADEDLDLLVTSPEHIFKADELDGHVRRISSYLRRQFGIPAPEVIPYHARAAWLARSNGDLIEGVHDHISLAEASRIGTVENLIQRFILEDAIPARLRAPRDILSCHISSLQEELEPFLGHFTKMTRSLNDVLLQLDKGTERARRRIVARLPQLRLRFQSTCNAIPGVIDEIIAARGNGGVLQSRWASVLQDHGVSECAAWFIEAGQRDFETEFAEQVRVAVSDFNISAADDFGDMLGDYHEKEYKAKRNK